MRWSTPVLDEQSNATVTVVSLVPDYMSGFGNTFETEALSGALPVGRNSPQRVNYGLYAEQLSGSPFTAPQATNQRSFAPLPSGKTQANRSVSGVGARHQFRKRS